MKKLLFILLTANILNSSEFYGDFGTYPQHNDEKNDAEKKEEVDCNENQFDIFLDIDRSDILVKIHFFKNRLEIYQDLVVNNINVSKNVYKVGYTSGKKINLKDFSSIYREFLDRTNEAFRIDLFHQGHYLKSVNIELQRFKIVSCPTIKIKMSQSIEASVVYEKN